jgi:hypothetical protein
MNHREPPHLSGAARKALHCLALLLLPAVAPKGADALPRAHPPRDRAGSPGSAPIPYLPALGTPSLRFQEATPPPDLVTRPPAAAPPQPALTTRENTIAADNAAAALSVASPAPEPAAMPVAPTKPAAKDSAPAAKTPSAIIPDDARPAVRPEDFLPYFQIPGAAKQSGDVTLLVPAPSSAPTAPSTIPNSSATYTTSPR